MTARHAAPATAERKTRQPARLGLKLKYLVARAGGNKAMAGVLAELLDNPSPSGRHRAQ